MMQLITLFDVAVLAPLAAHLANTHCADVRPTQSDELPATYKDPTRTLGRARGSCEPA